MNGGYGSTASINDATHIGHVRIATTDHVVLQYRDENNDLMALYGKKKKKSGNYVLRV